MAFFNAIERWPVNMHTIHGHHYQLRKLSNAVVTQLVGPVFQYVSLKVLHCKLPTQEGHDKRVL